MNIRIVFGMLKLKNSDEDKKIDDKFMDFSIFFFVLGLGFRVFKEE